MNRFTPRVVNRWRKRSSPRGRARSHSGPSPPQNEVSRSWGHNPSMEILRFIGAWQKRSVGGPTRASSIKLAEGEGEAQRRNKGHARPAPKRCIGYVLQAWRRDRPAERSSRATRSTGGGALDPSPLAGTDVTPEVASTTATTRPTGFDSWSSRSSTPPTDGAAALAHRSVRFSALTEASGSPRSGRTTGSRGPHGHPAPSRRSRRTGRSRAPPSRC